MKCPKCGYVGFDEGDRCRNCGYEFSLADVTTDEIPGRSQPPPPAEREYDAPLGPGSRPLDLDRIIGAPEPPRRGTPSSELPLFHDNATVVDDAPLVSPSAPRAPLSVRRQAPQAPRLRPRSAPPARELDLDGTDDESGSWEPSWHQEPALSHQLAEPATPGPRLLAALIDVTLILVIDVTVIYFTLRLCRLTVFEITQLPALPMLGFFLLLNGGYLAAFTAAGGQTVGKMSTGIRVVGDADQAVDFGRAVLRTLSSIVSVIPLGLGFIPAFFDEDRRALHDRLSGTRVIKALS